MHEQAIIGCLLGTAVGDALGLPYEGLSPNRAKRLLGPPDRYRFCFGRGMISDDTEHTCMVAQSLIESGSDLDLFTKRLAKRLRWWILPLPAGVGKATALSCIKLWLGVAPQRSGVWSAGNGPAMRAALFGAVFDDLTTLLRFVHASSHLTHTDPLAEHGAIVVAMAAREARLQDSLDAQRWYDSVCEFLPPESHELQKLLRQAISSVVSRESTAEFATSLGLSRGVTGFTNHTVPIAIHAWLSYPRDYQQAVTSTIVSGGDADTTAAIVGGIVGTGVGPSGIPQAWIDGLWETPRNVKWIISLGKALSSSSETSQATTAPAASWLKIIPRNLFFLCVVLYHGFRRLAPPY